MNFSSFALEVDRASPRIPLLLDCVKAVVSRNSEHVRMNGLLPRLEHIAKSRKSDPHRR